MLLWNHVGYLLIFTSAFLTSLCTVSHGVSIWTCGLAVSVWSWDVKPHIISDMRRGDALYTKIRHLYSACLWETANFEIFFFFLIRVSATSPPFVPSLWTCVLFPLLLCQLYKTCRKVAIIMPNDTDTDSELKHLSLHPPPKPQPTCGEPSQTPPPTHPPSLQIHTHTVFQELHP